MFEYEFKVGNVWLAVKAKSLDEAIIQCNKEIEGDEECLGFDGRGEIFRVQVDIEKVAEDNLYYTDDPMLQDKVS